jgi:hypothetical protein
MVGLKRWIADNPRGWAIIIGWAEEDAGNRRQIRTKEYEDRIRKVPNLYRSEKAYAWNNSWSAPASRLIAAERPDLAVFIPMRGSKYDPPTARPYDDDPTIAQAWANGRLFDEVPA